MNTTREVYNLEHKYNLEKFEEWNYIRIFYGMYLEKSTLHTKKNSSLKIKKIINFFKNSLFNIGKIFSHYDFIFFSDSSERINIGNQINFDKHSDPIVDSLSNLGYISLLIETPNSIHKNNSYTKNIISQNLISILSKLIFIKKSKSPIKKIFKEEGINLDVDKIIMNFQRCYKLYKILLTIYKPKAIFVNCAYCRMPLIKASRDLNIKVIEIQHGLISESHYAYYAFEKIDKSFYPSCLLSWGYLNKDEHFIIDKVHPIGHYLLEYFKESSIYNENKEKKNYKYTVAVTMQDEEEEYFGLLKFIKKLASCHKYILFIVVPRNIYQFSHILGEENIKISDLSCYEALMSSDYHMTVYSSCAIEASYFQKPNILLNINNMAKSFYRDILRNALYINDNYDPKSFIYDIEKLSVSNDNNLIINNYQKNLNKFINNLLGGVEYDK